VFHPNCIVHPIISSWTPCEAVCVWRSSTALSELIHSECHEWRWGASMSHQSNMPRMPPSYIQLNTMWTSVWRSNIALSELIHSECHEWRWGASMSHQFNMPRMPPSYIQLNTMWTSLWCGEVTWHYLNWFTVNAMSEDEVQAWAISSSPLFPKEFNQFVKFFSSYHPETKIQDGHHISGSWIAPEIEMNLLLCILVMPLPQKD
jgi:hypothetical protein